MVRKCLLVLFVASLTLFMGCGGGTSGSTPVGRTNSIGVRVQVVTEEGAVLPDQAVSLGGTDEIQLTDRSGIATFEVDSEESPLLSVGFEGTGELISLTTATDQTTFVGVLLQQEGDGAEVIKQVEMSVEAVGPCASFLRQKDGIDFFLERDLVGSVECVFRIVETESGIINRNLTGWRASLSCDKSEEDGAGTSTDLGIRAPVQPDGSVEIRLSLEERSKGCEVMLSREFARRPTVSPLNDAFNPRIILRKIATDDLVP